jgi:hypothetical protein
MDDREMADKFLDAKKQEYLDKNVETLRQNTEAFYTEIVTAIDPSITLTFEFAQ